MLSFGDCFLRLGWQFLTFPTEWDPPGFALFLSLVLLFRFFWFPGLLPTAVPSGCIEQRQATTTIPHYRSFCICVRTSSVPGALRKLSESYYYYYYYFALLFRYFSFLSADVMPMSQRQRILWIRTDWKARHSFTLYRGEIVLQLTA